MRYKFLIICSLLILLPLTSKGHGGDPDPTRIGIFAGQSFDFLLETYMSNVENKLYRIPELNQTIELVSGTAFTLTIVNSTLSLDNYTEKYWISSRIEMESNSTEVVQFVDENSLINFVDWETYEHTLAEELTGSKAFYENRGASFSYDIWLTGTEFGYSFQLDLSDESSTVTQEQIRIFGVTTGVLLYYCNSYQDNSGGQDLAEKTILRDLVYSYSSDSEESPLSNIAFLAIILLPILKKMWRTNKFNCNI